jgi:hypothetical protein
MATNPQGIMALPENDQMTSPQAAMPQMTLDDSYDAITKGLENASPEASLATKQALAQITPHLEALPPDQLEALMRIFQYLYDHPEEYKEKIADLVANGKFEQGDFPEEYDPEFLSVLILAAMDVRRRGQSQAPEQAMAPPPGMARGGIAEAARMAMSKGRGNDTMLAHITPKEAKMLRSKGGMGIINPSTGLPEYDWWSDTRDAITAPVRAVVDVAKQVVASPIGRVLATVGLAMVLGPAALGLSMPMAMAGASGLVTAIGGGNISDIMKSAAIGGATAFFGAPGGVVSNFVGGAVTNAAANAAISAGIVGTGIGLATGKNLQDSVKDGLVAGTVSGLVTGADKGFTTDMTAAKTGVIGEPSGQPGQPGAQGQPSLTPEQVQANIQRQAQQTAQQTALDQSGVNQPLTGPQASMPQGAPSGAAAGPGGAAAPSGPAPGYQVPSMAEGAANMGKGIMQMLPGTEGTVGAGYDQFMQGAGQVFAPSPTAQQVADYASANNMSVADAAKVMSPGIMRTYGPGIAAGIAATKAMGGFDTQPTTPSAARADVEDRLAKERAEVAANPGKYVPQGIPGLIYNDRGEIIGSKPWGSTATMDDIRVDTPDYVPRQKGSNYMAPQGALTQKGPGQSISQPYNTADMYTNLVGPNRVGAPIWSDPMPRYYAGGGNVAGGYSSAPPVHALFGGEIQNLVGSVSSFLKPVEQAFNSTTNAVANVVNPSAAAPTPAPPSSFSKDPFGKLSATDFQTNADAVARERAARVAQIQSDYETQNRNRAALDQAHAASGAATGRRIFFDPRAKNRPVPPGTITTMPVEMPAPVMGNMRPGSGTPIATPPNNYNIAPTNPAQPVATRASTPVVRQAPVVQQAPVAVPLKPTIRSAADTRGPVAMTAPTGAPPPDLGAAIADLKAGNQFAAVNKMRQIVGLPTFDNMQEYLASQAAEKAAVNKRTGGIANLTQSRYYPRKTGQISGPGTETSDSIPAMLSDGEFVMTAKAVKSLGKGDRRAGAKKMYALMHQLERNASRG